MANVYYQFDNLQENNNINDGDPKYFIPPNFQDTLKHHQSSKFRDNLNNQNQCQCCGRSVNKADLKFSNSIKRFSFGGSGYSIFFYYIILCGIIYLFGFLNNSLYSLIKNYQGTFCQNLQTVHQTPRYKSLPEDQFENQLIFNDKICISSLFNNLSLVNKQTGTVDVYELILMTINIIFVMILLHFYRYFARNFSQKIDDQYTTQDDFALFVQNIHFPQDQINYKQQLTELFTNSSLPNRKTPVADVILCYDLTEYQKLRDYEKKLIKKKSALTEKQQDLLQNKDNTLSNDQALQIVQRDLQQVNNELCQIENKILEFQKKNVKGYNEKAFIGQAFIIYENLQDKNEIVTQRRIENNDSFRNIFGCYHNHQLIEFNGEQIILIIAESPTDINWENLIYSAKNKLVRLLLTIFFLTLIQITALFSIFYLQVLALYVTKYYSGFVQFLVSQAISISIAITNAILSALVNLCVLQQKHYDLIRQRSNAAVQSTLLQFFNSALCMIIYTIYTDTWYTYSIGFISQQTNNFIVNAFVPQLLIFLDLGYIITYIQRKWELRKGPNSLKTQNQANKLFQDPQFDIAGNYASIGYNIILFYLYFSFLPIASIFMLISVILQFYLYKQQLIQRSSFINYINCQINEFFIDIIEFALIMYVVGRIIMDYILFGNCHFLSWINLSIAIIYFFLPNQLINEKIIQIKYEEENKQYQNYKYQFDQEYNLENPATNIYCKIQKLEYLQSQELKGQDQRQAINQKLYSKVSDI